jgi:DNA polymerase III epsilon subunit-like protein
MYCLFLDTETTSLSPTSGQIIEIAGIVTKLDKVNLDFEIVDSFESLVALRGVMDDKITRITGITQETLQEATPIHKVQENWASFLEKYPEVVVIGHSIDFDLGFLTSESWFLPNGFKFIDTLDIAKISFTNMSAVNLEFLVEKLSLHPTEKQIKLITNETNSALQPHRAMYDTICCVNLLSNSLSKLDKIGLGENFYTRIKALELLDINLFSKPDLPTLENKTLGLGMENVITIDFAGKIIPKGMWASIESLGEKSIGEILDGFLALNLPPDYNLILLQMVSINNQKILENNPSHEFKIHTKNQKELHFALSILTEITKMSDHNPIYELFPLETLIPNIGKISEKTFEIGKLTTLLEIYLDIVGDNLSNSDDKMLITKILAIYSFMLLALQPLYQRGQFIFDKNRLEVEQLPIKRKIEELTTYLLELCKNKLPVFNSISEIITIEIEKNLEEFFENGQLQIDIKNRLTFRYYQNQLTISKQILGFNLTKTIQKTLANYPDLILPTFLEKGDFDRFLQLSGLSSIMAGENVQFLNEDCQELEQLEGDLVYSELLDNLILSGKNSGKINLILGGQNSTIRDSERILTKYHKPNEYLLLGESGSLTKILSKMLNGFNGVVVIKVGDFGYLKKFANKLQFESVYIVNSPYFNIANYWFNQAMASGKKEGYLKELKDLYLSYIASVINKVTGKKVHYIRSYR